MQASSSDWPAATNFILTSASRMIASASYFVSTRTAMCKSPFCQEENQWAVPMRRRFLVSFMYIQTVADQPKFTCCVIKLYKLELPVLCFIS
jgi:hypothetical protein